MEIRDGIDLFLFLSLNGLVLYIKDDSAFVSLDPALAKKQILHALSHQYESGNAIRMYEPDFKYPYYDMPVWIPETVTQYIKETGDFEILWISVPYLDSELSENVFCHVKRGLDFLLTNRGVHNLVLWGGGDWNDILRGLKNWDVQPTLFRG